MKAILPIIIIITLIISGCEEQKGQEVDNTQKTTADSITGRSVGIDAEAKTVTIKELSGHNIESDCWVGYKGKAYDMTEWIPKHPGGIFIKKYCGTAMEFQNAFLKKHAEKYEGKLANVTKYIGEIQE